MPELLVFKLKHPLLHGIRITLPGGLADAGGLMEG